MQGVAKINTYHLTFIGWQYLVALVYQPNTSTYMHMGMVLALTPKHVEAGGENRQVDIGRG